MEEFEFEEEYHEQADIRKFCRALEVAWKCTPELQFHQALENIFNGYNLSELALLEMEEMIADYIIQNS